MKSWSEPMNLHCPRHADFDSSQGPKPSHIEILGPKISRFRSWRFSRERTSASCTRWPGKPRQNANIGQTLGLFFEKE